MIMSAGLRARPQEAFQAQSKGRRSFLREQREAEELKGVRHQRCGNYHTAHVHDTPASRVLTVRVCCLRP